MGNDTAVGLVFETFFVVPIRKNTSCQMQVALLSEVLSLRSSSLSIQN